MLLVKRLTALSSVVLAACSGAPGPAGGAEAPT
jgi:hypothetical protein